MSEKYKHSEQLVDLLRYMNDAMIGEERYKFERELERDPFLQEAFEGLSVMKPSEIDRDIRGMDVIAGKKGLSLGFLKYFAYAAGFALLIFGGYWAFNSIDFSKHQIVKNETDTIDQKFREPYKPVIVAGSVDSSSVDSTKILVADATLQQKNNLQQQAIGVSTNLQGQLPKTEAPGTTKESVKKKAAFTNAVPQSALKAEENSNTETAPIQNTTESKPADIVSEPAPTTTTDSREDIEEPMNALKRPGVNAEPQPLGGSSLFKNYVDSNTKYPEGIKSTRKEFVKIRFKVTKSGEPTAFFIERSPSDLFSQEAIRVIRNGPKWSPEIKDGIPVVGEVTLKINFKPEEK
jgi:TonB family protein